MTKLRQNENQESDKGTTPSKSYPFQNQPRGTCCQTTRRTLNMLLKLRPMINNRRKRQRALKKFKNKYKAYSRSSWSRLTILRILRRNRSWRWWCSRLSRNTITAIATRKTQKNLFSEVARPASSVNYKLLTRDKSHKMTISWNLKKL